MLWVTLPKYYYYLVEIDRKCHADAVFLDKVFGFRMCIGPQNRYGRTKKNNSRQDCTLRHSRFISVSNSSRI